MTKGHQDNPAGEKTRRHRIGTRMTLRRILDYRHSLNRVCTGMDKKYLPLKHGDKVQLRWKAEQYIIDTYGPAQRKMAPGRRYSTSYCILNLRSISFDAIYMMMKKYTKQMLEVYVFAMVIFIFCRWLAKKHKQDFFFFEKLPYVENMTVVTPIKGLINCIETSFLHRHLLIIKLIN